VTEVPDDLPRWSFGDSPELADELLALVLLGRKTATCWAVAQMGPTVAGERSIILDGAGLPAALVETISCEAVRFCDVGADFAAAEGEGDLTLEHWRAAHQRYFTRQAVFAADMLLWCERFKLLRAPLDDAGVSPP
jgi:uncharacterized protein YhfF